MRILHTVEFYWPSIGGSQEVVRQLSERMAALGHDVTVATSKIGSRDSTIHNGVRIQEFDIKGNMARGYTGETKDYVDFIKKGDFDVIMNYAAQQWATDLILNELGSIKARKIFVPCGFSGLYDPLYKTYFENMPRWLKKYDATIYLSNDYRDINFARKHKINNCVVIPNGAGEDEFESKSKLDIRRSLGIIKDSFIFLTVGSHTGLKGHLETIEIFKKLNLKNSTLLIAANNWPGGCGPQCKRASRKFNFGLTAALKRQRIIVKSLSRLETIAAYHSADLFLFPSNIEASPLVLFEAAASKTPFAVTDVGNSKEIIEWTQGGFLLPTFIDKEGYSHAYIPESVEEISKQISNPSNLDSMSKNGYTSWKKNFSWEVIVQKYLMLYRGEKKK